ncbi:unnamed protein product [Rotaria sp. Silwood1]|nr:unnamed protein product [Rotaria sp. Silwood1]
MPTSIDLVFCIDFTSSTMSNFNQIRPNVLSVCVTASASQGDVCIGIIKFRSCHDTWKTKVYGFTQNIHTIQQVLSDYDLGRGSPDGYEAAGETNTFFND